MKVIHATERTVIAVIKENNDVEINGPLKEELRINGIPIPDYLQEQYGNQRVVAWDDPYFSKAFLEVYLPHQLRESGYVVEE